MKKILNIIIFAAIMLGTYSCSDYLEEKVYTKPSIDYLISTPAGMASCVLAMYYQERNFYYDNSSTYFMNMCIGSDIQYVRAGEGVPTIGRYITLTSGNSFANEVWSHFYANVGYANLVVNTSKNVDMTDPVAIQALAEAKAFRAYSYFWLLRKFDRIYLTTRVTTPENVNDSIHYYPADPDSVYQLINEDLDYAIEHLSWTTSQPGRFTQGVVRHIKAKVAACQGNWQEVANQVNIIDKSGVYSLLPLEDIFKGTNLNNREAIFVSQWDQSIGGANMTSSGAINGHQIALHFIPTYNQEKGMVMALDQGGYPWGRLFPNTYLLSLYNKSVDKRYNVFYKLAWTYNDPVNLPRGKKLGDTIVATNSAQYLNVHPACMKYDDPTRPTAQSTRSYKDIIIYRLAETYLMGAEAYLHLGNADSTAYYYNKTWVRAGNNPVAPGTVTFDMIVDEHARELAFEGDRWFFLKRNGILIERTRLHGGEYLKNAQGIVLNNDTVIRQNIQPFHVRLPIPTNQILQMGAQNFPQNEGY